LGVGPTAVLDAVGAPSRWIARQKPQRSGKDHFTTPAEDSHLASLHLDLCNRDPDVRQRAAESFAGLCLGERLARAVAGNLPPLLKGLKASEESPVKLALLGALRTLTERGHALTVAQHSYALVQVLKDEDLVVRRKVAALYRVLAEEGAAAMIARDVSSIMGCFEACQAGNTSLMAPLEALTAIANAGEGTAVAHLVNRLLAGLKDRRPRIRHSTCKTLAAIARGGAKELLGHLGLSVSENLESTSTATLFEMLVCISLDDADEEVRLAAADALRCLPEGDAETAETTCQEYPQLVKRVQRLVGKHAGEVGAILRAVFACPQPEAEDEDRLCVICQEPLELNGGSEQVSCGHIFHRRCMDRWCLWSNRCSHAPSCPLCRAKLPCHSDGTLRRR